MFPSSVLCFAAALACGGTPYRAATRRGHALRQRAGWRDASPPLLPARSIDLEAKRRSAYDEMMGKRASSPRAVWLIMPMMPNMAARPLLRSALSLKVLTAGTS